MKILHITESLAAGVGQYLAMVANAQAAASHQVVIVHSERPETPVNQLDQIFGGHIKRIVVPMVTSPSLKADMIALYALIKIIRHESPNVIHLHSSKAGVLGRVAARVTGKNARLFYSPHGFAFLRQDVSPLKRYIFLMFERLARIFGGCLIACSASEAKLARERVKSRAVMTVENAIDLSELPPWQGGTKTEVQVVNSGRVVFVKNPSCFAKIAEACGDLPAQFTWIGGGELECLLKEPKLSHLEVTGWMDRCEVIDRIAQADVFLMTSITEGMPLALIEAQAVGVPAVVPDVIGCRDVVEDGVTGYVCSSLDEMIDTVRILIQDTELRRKLGNNAARLGRHRFDVRRLNRELLDLYQLPL